MKLLNISIAKIKWYLRVDSERQVKIATNKLLSKKVYISSHMLCTNICYYEVMPPFTNGQ